jgi:hypothetical protein
VDCLQTKGQNTKEIKKKYETKNQKVLELKGLKNLEDLNLYSTLNALSLINKFYLMVSLNSMYSLLGVSTSSST